MLVRASSRKLRRDGALQARSRLESLPLHFLCPALYTRPVRSRMTSSQSHSPSKLSPRQTLPTLHARTVVRVALPHRGLASAATVEYGSQHENHIPFESSSDFLSPRSSRIDRQKAPLLLAYGDPSPLILEDAPPTIAPGKMRTVNGVSPDLNEIHQTLHACLQVGRLQRAAALVRRLNNIYKPNAPGLLAAHNDYIRDTTLRIVQTKDQKLLRELQTWFEVDFRQYCIPASATTYALMIQASRQELFKGKVSRAIRRYLKFARESGIEEETLALVPELEKTLEATNDFAEDNIRPAQPGAVEYTSPESSTTQTGDKHELPEVRGVVSKGAGLSALKQSLSIFSRADAHSKASKDANESIDPVKFPQSATERQKLLEKHTLESAIDRWRLEDAHLKSLGLQSNLASFSLGAILWKWHEKLVLAIKEEMKEANEDEKKEQRDRTDEDRFLCSPFIQSISPELVSASTILCFIRTMANTAKDDHGVRVVTLVHTIGESVHEECIAQRIRDSCGSVSRWRNLSSQPENIRRLVRLRKSPRYNRFINDEEIPSEPKYENVWPNSVMVRVGAILLSKLQEVAEVEISRRDPKSGKQLCETQPALFHSYRFEAGHRLGVVRLNTALLEQLSKVPVSSAMAKHLPMVAEPRPWVNFHEGGYYEMAVSAVRLKGADVQSKRYAKAAAENGDMSQVFSGLDVLAKTAWRINRSVFDVMLEAWNTGEAIASIPPENPTCEYPPEPPASEGSRSRQNWMKKVREIENLKSGKRAERCFQNFQLEVARSYLNETFYFPHNVDFRGRAYPIAPFLNHLGSDNARGLLMFAKGKELGPNGLRWLKIHLANLFGYDKASFAERGAFTDDHLSDIRDSASQPFSGKRWWLEAEDPWQCLAACKELQSALDLPDPTKFVSHLAIHQDGTCNGLQHYAALGGDAMGAKQVNLEPGDRPSDIYTAVAELVKSEVHKDAGKGIDLARELDGKVTRKVVKQTVMTNVYGVTYMGAKLQVEKQLKDLYPAFPEYDGVNFHQASKYIAKKIFQALADMFNGAHEIQYWLGDCATRICKSVSPSQIALFEGAHNGTSNGEASSPFRKKASRGPTREGPPPFITPVIWTTPLKMPVVQPYRKHPSHKVSTNLQCITLSKQSAADPIDKARQLQAFPPNFVHSLDGTHMFLTAHKCHELGLAFAAVHDSFWTHACDVETMNGVIRDAFIFLHSENIIARLAAEFSTRYKDYMQLVDVKTSSDVAQKIRDWRIKSRASRKVGKTMLARELLLEHRRLRLLASDNAEEREEGARMVTPGSIFAENANEDDLSPPEHQPTALGGISLRQMKLKANEQLQVGDKSNAEIVEHKEDVDVGTLEGSSEGEDIQNEESTQPTDSSMKEASSEASDVEDETQTSESELEEDAELETASSKKRLRQIWLPLKFPPVPKKGDFDVTRLRNSQYFFS